MTLKTEATKLKDKIDSYEPNADAVLAKLQRSARTARILAGVFVAVMLAIVIAVLW